MNVPGAFKPEKYYFAVILSIDELTFFFFRSPFAFIVDTIL